MKQMTCAEMGGPATCTTVISGNTPEEMSANGTKHVNEAHPDIAESMKSMPKEAMDKWTADFKEKFSAAPKV
jgi:predicted small metal-binding protein